MERMEAVEEDVVVAAEVWDAIGPGMSAVEAPGEATRTRVDWQNRETTAGTSLRKEDVVAAVAVVVAIAADPVGEATVVGSEDAEADSVGVVDSADAANIAEAAENLVVDEAVDEAAAARWTASKAEKAAPRGKFTKPLLLLDNHTGKTGHGRKTMKTLNLRSCVCYIFIHL